jgi:alkaline phosphatase
MSRDLTAPLKSACLLLAILSTCLLSVAEADSRNVILFVGDGMGPEQVKAAGLLAHGEAGKLSLETLPHRGQVMTASADNTVTDSAAGATAYATGVRVRNGVISRAIPGDGPDLETILERSKGEGRRTGLVTTTYLTHATPAAFGAHASGREDTEEIGLGYLTRSLPDVLLGGGSNGLCRAGAVLAGYTVVTKRDGLLAVDPGAIERLCGLFGSTHLPYEYDGLGDLPHLSEMTRVALSVLERAPEGFFLVVEGGRIDHACHDNDIHRALPEVVELSNAVTVALQWAKERDDTLILVTADHETGGLSIRRSLGAERYPEVRWSTTGHTGLNVPIYAWGPGAERVAGVLHNVEVHRIMLGFLEGRIPASAAAPAEAATEPQAAMAE